MNPYQQLIAERAAYKAGLDNPIPVAKYHLIVSITANSRDELSDRIHALDVNWDYQYGQRDEVDSTDGTTTTTLVHTNPQATPESYRAELDAWSARNRAERQ